MRLRDVIAGIGCPGYTTDAEGRIIDLNRSAELLFGYDRCEILGKKCHELLAGGDMYGDRFCQQECTIRAVARGREPVSPFSLTVTSASGEQLAVKIHIVTEIEPGDGSISIAHLLQPDFGHSNSRTSPPASSTELSKSDSEMASEDSSGARAFRLTKREIDVLRLMAQGKNCAGISSILQIAVATTRNHIRNILRKLDVHSQAEAISFTYRNGLL